MLRASGHYMFEPVTSENITPTVASSQPEITQNTQQNQPTETSVGTTPFSDDSRPESHPAFAEAVFRIKRKNLAVPARARIVGNLGARVNVEVFEGEVLPVRAPKKAEARYLKDLESLEVTRSEQATAGHLEGLKIVKPIEFTSQSAASKFVVGSASNGNTDWVLESDPSVSLGAFLQNLEDSQS